MTRQAYCHNCRCFMDHRLYPHCPRCGHDDSMTVHDSGRRQSLGEILRSLLYIAIAIAGLWCLCALTIGGPS
jgi:uncharacterized paraquat-inducible protein A